MIIVVGGATSSGKSKLGFYFAKELNGEIISLDASQVYKEVPIGSGIERSNIPQHLVEIFPPTEEIDSSKVIKLAKESLEDIQRRGKTPIVVAGSTMYLTQFLHGLADLPSGSKELREKWKERSTESLYDELKKIDSETSLSKNDRPRIERALEVKHLTGRSIKEFQEEHKFSSSLPEVRLVCIWWDRQILYKRIEERCEAMILTGLVDEIRNLAVRYGTNCPAMKNIGYKEFLRVIFENKPLLVVKEEFIRQTRHYAKRQMTYWKNEPKKRGWIVEPSSGAIRGDEVILRKGPKAKGVFVYELRKEKLLEKILQTGENHLLNVAGEFL